MFDVAPFMVESSVGVLLTGVAPAICVPDVCCVWLGVKLKSRILPFAPADPFNAFTLLTEPFAWPTGFSFLFFGASSASTAISISCEVLERRMLPSCEV